MRQIDAQHNSILSEGVVGEGREGGRRSDREAGAALPEQGRDAGLVVDRFLAVVLLGCVRQHNYNSEQSNELPQSSNEHVRAEKNKLQSLIGIRKIARTSFV
jgi:hypothetical protein